MATTCFQKRVSSVAVVPFLIVDAVVVLGKNVNIRIKLFRARSENMIREAQIKIKGPIWKMIMCANFENGTVGSARDDCRSIRVDGESDVLLTFTMCGTCIVQSDGGVLRDIARRS